MIGIDDISDSPWNRGGWHGSFLSLDGAEATDFAEEDVERVIAYGDTGKDDWDGSAAGIVLLKDGRFVAWESGWGPTGSGFSCDAYGGEADIAFAQTLEAAKAYISEQSIALLKWNDSAA